ncbi:MAG: hypothetical protein PHV20_09345 [Bacteroidales bacterium]|nr:hypothetical protein [Bacteroidales bacterium]
MYYIANNQIKSTRIFKPKYTSVKLVSVYNPDYRAKRAEYIESKRILKPIDFVPCQRSPIDLVSRSVENFLQQLQYSIPNRILSYKVHYQCNYILQFRELDMVRIENDGSVTVAEIKVTSNVSQALKKAIEQLSRSVEILTTVFKKVNPKIIIIDLSDDAVKSAKQLKYKFKNCLECIIEYYSYPELLHLMDSLKYQFDRTLLEKAHSEARKLASIRVAKEQVKLNPIYLAQ